MVGKGGAKARARAFSRCGSKSACVQGFSKEEQDRSHKDTNVGRFSKGSVNEQERLFAEVPA